MSVGTMQSKSKLNEFYQHGYAFVTDSSVTYAYNEAMSEITSKYNVTTELKRGGFSNVTMQLMLPHQWKLSSQNNANNVYPSIRGDMHGVGQHLQQWIHLKVYYLTLQCHRVMNLIQTR